MLRIFQYILPVLIITVGILNKYSKDKAWDSSRKLSSMLIVIGTLLLLARIILDYTKNNL